MVHHSQNLTGAVDRLSNPSAEALQRLAAILVRNDRVDEAARILLKLQAHKDSGLKPAVFLAALMETCTKTQAPFVSYLLHEFLTPLYPQLAFRFLQQRERQMYKRLGVDHGVENGIRQPPGDSECIPPEGGSDC